MRRLGNARLSEPEYANDASEKPACSHEILVFIVERRKKNTAVRSQAVPRCLFLDLRFFGGA